MGNSRSTTPAVGRAGLIPVAQYVRMSTEHQRYSTENQSIAIEQYARENGMRVVRTYTDSGKSGLSLHGRRGLQQLLADVQTPRPGFVAVLVYDVSRWGRFQDPDEAGEYERVCRRNGVQVEYCAEQFKNDGSISATVMLSIKRSMAAEYSRELSVKVSAGQKLIVERGYHLTGAPGLGLRRMLVDEQGKPKTVLERGQRKALREDHIVLAPGPQSEVDTVLSIYDMYAEQGLTEWQIVERLNRAGVANAVGRPWCRKTVHNVLTNEKYIGNNVFNRRSFKLKIRWVKNAPEDWYRKDGAFPAIVPAELFWRVQVKLAAHRKRWEGEELLHALRQTWLRHGTLSARVIGQDGGPAVGTYAQEFGSLLNAYEAIGFKPPHNYARVNKKSAPIHWRQELIAAIVRGVEKGGGSIKEDIETGFLVVNGNFTVSLAIAMCNRHRNGQRTWGIRLNPRREADVAVVAKMNLANDGFLDYLVIPTMADTGTIRMLRPGGTSQLDVFRCESLDQLLEAAKLVPLSDCGLAEPASIQGAPVPSNIGSARAQPCLSERPPRRNELEAVYQRENARLRLIQKQVAVMTAAVDQAQRIMGELLGSKEFHGVMSAAEGRTAIPACLARPFPEAEA